MIAAIGRAGVVAPTDLAVTANGTPNMSVNVAAGAAFVPGTEATFQGNYFFQNDAVVNLVVAASDPTNPRIDLVVARVRDADYSGATNDASVAVITGTPAASPVVPATPADSILLAQVAVAANAASVVAGNITDKRARATSILAPDVVNNYTGSARGDNGAATGWTTLSVTPSPPTFAPPFPYRMIVIANGRVGFGAANNTLSLRIDDGAGTDLTDTSGIDTYSLDLVAGKFQAASLIAHVDRAAGVASTFNIAYNVSTSSVYVRLGIEAYVIPR